MTSRFHRACLIFLLTASLHSAATGQTDSFQRENAKECAICHLQWVATFDRPGARVLIDKPVKPVVAGSETCLGCHDGSVVDSRQRVWLEHGHRTDVTPPSSIKVPPQLPLEDGKVTCRTCHSAHGNADTADPATAVFIRVPGPPGQLCQMCHVDKTAGPGLGTHPIGGMPWPIPSQLIEAGAKAHPGERKVHCQICHMAHGSREEHLLVMGVDNNRLCLTCHKELRPRMWRPGRKGAHPDRPIIKSPEQIEAIKTMGTRIGRENRLVCLSCHRLHHGKSGRFMLADDLKGSKFCLHCHSRQTSLFDSAHDLRKSAPDSKNLLGMKPSQAGPCGSCHMFHNLAVRPIPTKADPMGVCTGCHTSGRLAGKMGTLMRTHSVNVPVPALATDSSLPLFPSRDGESDEQVMTCLTCHDPHDGSRKAFLRDTPDGLCQSCHANIAEEMVGGHHDAGTVKSGWPVPVEKDARCLACHKIHSWEKGGTLWAFALSKDRLTSDAVCTGCHEDVQWCDGDTPYSDKTVLHPRTGDMPGGADVKLVAKTNGGPADQIGCRTCHSPHGGRVSYRLLRQSESGQPAAICFECHTEAASVDYSMHSRRAMRLKETDARGCKPCHAVHAINGSSRDMLWAAEPSGEGASASEKRCRGCHRSGGSAKPPADVFRHPQEPLDRIALQQLTGQETPVKTDRITCVTCHLPHGKPTLSHTQKPLAQLSAEKPMLRTDVARAVCAACHGVNALQMFLYYHYPDKRK